MTRSTKVQWSADQSFMSDVERGSRRLDVVRLRALRDRSQAEPLS
jgi:hypothetical protein